MEGDGYSQRGAIRGRTGLIDQCEPSESRRRPERGALSTALRLKARTVYRRRFGAGSVARRDGAAEVAGRGGHALMPELPAPEPWRTWGCRRLWGLVGEQRPPHRLRMGRGQQQQ